MVIFAVGSTSNIRKVSADQWISPVEAFQPKLPVWLRMLCLREIRPAGLKLAVELLTLCRHVVENASWLCELVVPVPAASRETPRSRIVTFPAIRK
jgi:hypothetical protein